MIVAPPIVHVVQTAFAQALFAPPSLSASSREPSASVASTATVMAVPSAMAKVAPTPARENPLRYRKYEHEDRASAGPDADRAHHCHDFSPGEGARELPRIDDMITRLSRRVMMMLVIVTMIVMVMIMRMAVCVVAMGVILGMMLGMIMRGLFVGHMRCRHAAPVPE